MKTPSLALNKNLTADEQRYFILKKLEGVTTFSSFLNFELIEKDNFSYREIKEVDFHILNKYLTETSKIIYNANLTKHLIDNELISKEEKILFISNKGSYIESFFDDIKINVDEFIIKSNITDDQELLFDTSILNHMYLNKKTSNKFSKFFIRDKESIFLMKRSKVFFAIGILKFK